MFIATELVSTICIIALIVMFCVVSLIIYLEEVEKYK